MPDPTPDGIEDEAVTQPVDPRSRVRLDFFLASHRDERDIYRFEEYLAQADVVVLEAVGWTEELEDLFNLVSQGKIDPAYPLVNNEYFLEILRIMHGTKKPILFADLQHNSPEEADNDQAEKALSRILKMAREDFRAGNFTGYLLKIRESNDIAFKRNKEREEHILRSLENKLALLCADPKFAGVDSIKVLVNYGIYHLSLVRTAKKAGFKVRRNMESSTTVLDTSGEALNRKNLGQEMDDLSCARILIEDELLILIIHGASYLNINQVMWLTRKISARLTLQDLKNLSEGMGRCNNARQKDLLEGTFLAEKGVVVPYGIKEVQDIMGADWERFRKLGKDDLL